MVASGAERRRYVTITSGEPRRPGRPRRRSSRCPGAAPIARPGPLRRARGALRQRLPLGGRERLNPARCSSGDWLGRFGQGRAPRRRTLHDASDPLDRAPHEIADGLPCSNGDAIRRLDGAFRGSGREATYIGADLAGRADGSSNCGNRDRPDLGTDIANPRKGRHGRPREEIDDATGNRWHPVAVLRRSLRPPQLGPRFRRLPSLRHVSSSSAMPSPVEYCGSVTVTTTSVKAKAA